MNNEVKNNLDTFSFFTLWFGAAVSIAEILTGGLLAPLGFKKAAAAIVIGHAIGGGIMVLGGIIGSKSRMPAIMSTRISFGKYGVYLFSVLNVLQLIGWTTVMVIVGARSVNMLADSLWGFNSQAFWSIFIGALICLWIAFGTEGWKKLNVVAAVLLFLLTIMLSFVVFKDGSVISSTSDGTMTFGGAVELSVVMPLSWLPLIADYTRFAKSNKAGALGSFAGYFFGSSWMYIIGVGAAIAFNNTDPGAVMLAANLGFAALGIVILSTVTTTFMDAYSAGVTLLNIAPKLKEKNSALIMSVIGTIIALAINMEQYENFLYAIGSVFAPMFAIVFTDYFLFNIKNIEDKLAVNWTSVVTWIIGIILYYQFVKVDFILGATVPVMILTGVIYLIIREVTRKWNYLKQYVKI